MPPRLLPRTVCHLLAVVVTPGENEWSGWASLTPTEVEVVKLVATGLTNPEVGERLFIGRGTVKTHLAHVFAKLGIATRTELAAEATRRAL